MKSDRTYEDLDARIRVLELTLAASQRTARKAASSRSRGIGLGIAATLGVVVLFEGGISYSQTAMCPQTLPAPLVTFCAQSPAIASEVNGNFQWVVDKIGMGGSGISTTQLTASGGLSVGGDISDPNSDVVINDNLRINGRIVPSYATYADPGSANGGASIVNDNGSFDALMILGNRAAGGQRRVHLWDDVTVDSDLAVKGTFKIGNTTIGETELRVLKALKESRLQVAIASAYNGALIDHFHSRVNNGDNARTIQFRSNQTIDNNTKMKLRIAGY